MKANRTAQDGLLNVKSFGARGDGVADDTAAIQAAFQGLGGLRSADRWRNERLPVTGPEVLFPPGRYRLTGSIRIPPFGLMIRGTGSPSIMMQDDGKDVFYSECDLHPEVRGMTFVGGRTQLSLGNPNIDKGLFLIEGCKFPFLTWCIRPTPLNYPNKHAVKVIDRATGLMQSLAEVEHGWREYLAFNLRDKLRLSGRRSFDIRFYYLASHYVPPTEGQTFAMRYARPGDYLVLDFLRFEAEGTKQTGGAR